METKKAGTNPTQEQVKCLPRAQCHQNNGTPRTRHNDVTRVYVLGFVCTGDKYVDLCQVKDVAQADDNA